MGPQLLPLLGLQPRHRFYTVGNHEYYHGSRGDAAPWEAFFARSLNFTVLHNSRVRLTARDFPERGCGAGDSLTVAGVPDLWEDKSDLAAAINGTDTGDEWLLLAHQPMQFPAARDMQPHVSALPVRVRPNADACCHATAACLAARLHGALSLLLPHCQPANARARDCDSPKSPL